MISTAAGSGAPETGFPDPIERDRHLTARFQILDVTLDGPVADGALNGRLGAAQKPLPVGEAPTARVQPSVDDLHRIS
jgi:hypothetical protein